MPFRARSGRLSDGARLLELRSDVRAAKALDARKAAPRLFRAGRAKELLELHAGLDVPARRMSVPQAAGLTVVEFNVVLLPGLKVAEPRARRAPLSSRPDRKHHLLRRRSDFRVGQRPLPAEALMPAIWRTRKVPRTSQWRSQR
jgi:hypothetical protein